MTARGAAGLAGLATGFWQSPDEFAAARPDEAVFEPKMESAERAGALAGWQRAVNAARAWATEG